MKNDSSLAGKIAWITGGGSGIGLAGALELARAGAHVVISGRTAATNDKALAELKKAGSAEATLLDVSDKAAVARTAADIEKRHGRIDILVTSAGTNIGGGRRNLKTMAPEGWDDVVAINLSGLFYCCYAVLPGMRARKDGLIINISSWAGRYASVLTGPAYNATKRAVIALTESINMEECANGIRATSILPGEVATPILEKRPVPPSAEERSRMAQAEDLGKAILFVATMPARTCVNELIIAPTWNRFYLGGLERK
jgi:NADP-dependent 3-hydroxy acid dehydrogenase YdfG